MTCKEIKIKLYTIKDVSDFVSLTSIIPNIIYAKQDKYVINAKSGIGLYSLDLNRHLLLSVSGDLNPAFEYDLRKFEVLST